MTHVLVVLLALLIGIVAGLRALTPPAVVAWAALLDWLHVEGTWASWIAHPIVVGLLTVLLVIELITDQLSRTPSRKTTVQFATRLITAGFAGAVIGTAWGYEFTALAAAVVGAFLGTIGGYGARKRLAAAFGRDLPAALLEDVVAVGGVSWPCTWRAWYDATVRRDHRRRRAVRSAGRPTDRRRSDGRGGGAQADRRHVCEHRLHPDQDVGGQRACGALGPVRRRAGRRHSTDLWVAGVRRVQRRRCHRHRLRRRHPPTSSDIGFAPESAGVHPLLAAGHRGVMAARVEAAWKS